jgi:hypothetical protein
MSCELSFGFVDGAVGSAGEVAGLVCVSAGEVAGANWSVAVAGAFADGAGEVVCASAMVTRPINAIAVQQKGLKRLAISMSGN